jgi:hypothetical protein
MRFSNLTRIALEPAQRLTLLRVVVAIALICALLLSWRLWISSRLFPSAPLFSLPKIPFPIDYICLAALIALMVSVAVRSNARYLLSFEILSAGLLCFDQMRWQPWFYQYFFLIAGLTVYAWRKPNPRVKTAILNSSAIIVLSTYFWSGVQKLNAAFLKESWPDFSNRFFHLLLRARSTPSLLGLNVPLLEISIAAGLLSRRFRNLAVILAIIAHLIILLFLFASGENTVVWPWNVAMAMFVAILFWQNKDLNVRKLFAPKHPFHALVLILFVIMPAFNLVDLWDSYLSFALYSGNSHRAVIYVSQSVSDQLPVSIRPYTWLQTEPNFLDINRWSYGELNVPVYPEPRVFRQVTRNVCALAGNSPDIKLVLWDQPDLITAHRDYQVYDCNHLY